MRKINLGSPYQTKKEILQISKNILLNYSLHKINDIDKASEIAFKIMKKLINNEDIIFQLYKLKKHDYYSFKHSVHVSAISLLMGICMGYDIKRLKDLGTGALLHDVGKIKISQEILQKPGKLTKEEFEEIKKHPEYGYEIMKNSKKINKSVASIAFGHHERYDGTGYPLRLKGEAINQDARVVAIADVFDALTSDRVYRKKTNKKEVINYIKSLSIEHFDTKVVKIFTSFTYLYPSGTQVILNTKEKGIVVKSNKKTPLKPIVKIMYDSREEKIEPFYELDLMKAEGVYIDETIESNISSF